MMIKTNNLRKVYGKDDNICIALRNVSFNIDKGEFVAICGTSGSGKTTLFNIISGVNRNYEGECFVDGVNLHTLSDDEMTIMRRNKIGVIFQFFNLISSLTVEENIELCARLDNKSVSREDINSILKTLKLEDKGKSYIHELSGGQQQRVAIGRVMLSNADLILADEPTGNLDSANTQNIMSIFKTMKEQNKTIIIITHDKEVAELADRVIYIEDGMVA